MKAYLSLIAICILSLSVTSCHKRIIRGNNNEQSETRYLQSFSKIELNGSQHVNIVKSEDYYVRINGSSNLLPQFETRVKGDRLILEYNDRYWNVKNDDIRIDVYTPYVDGIKVNGSGDIQLASKFEQDDFKAKINGSGSLVMANATYKNVDFDINGSGRVTAKNITSENAYIDISGSGEVYVYVTNHLNVDISGSGDVYYYGNPSSITSDISGSGKLHRRD